MRRDDLILAACGKRLERKRTWAWLPGALRGLYRRIPAWADKDDLGRAYRAQKELLGRGRLVWGCIVQANTELFRPGRTKLPAEAVFSIAEDQDTESLRKMANALFTLKGTQPADPGARKIADHLAVETTRVFGLSLPREMDPDQKHRLSTIMVFRQHLPDGKLGANHFPLLILESGDFEAMILPSSLWPMVLRREWGLPEPKMTLGLLFGYKLVALFYLAFGMFLGGLLHLTADGKMFEYAREHPIGVAVILLTNGLSLIGLSLIGLKRLKSQAEEMPELRPEHLK